MVTRAQRFGSPEVKSVFDRYRPEARRRLMAVRALIFEAAAATKGVGALTETLKWGQPSYLTAETGSGSTVRIDAVKNAPGRIAVYFHCQSGLVPAFRELYADTLTFEGKRAILIEDGDDLPAAALTHCIKMALTHHAQKKGRAS